MKYLIFCFGIMIILLSCVSTKTRVVKLEYQKDGCKEERLTRVYLNDSIFVEYFQFDLSSTGKVSRIDTFKIINQNWFIKKCGEFKIYFSVDKFRDRDTIYEFGSSCRRPLLKLIPQKEDTIDGKILFKFKVEERHYNYFAPIIWFDPDVGTVKNISKSAKCEESYLKIISDEFLDKNALNNLGIKN